MCDQDADKASDSTSGLYLGESDFNNTVVHNSVVHNTVAHFGGPGHSLPSEHAGSGANRAAKKTSHPNPTRHKGKVAPEKVLQAFNTWAFKREQPDNPPLMLQTISRSIAQGEPIPFVLYWGKGPRSAIDAPDVECLEYIASLTRRIGDIYPRGAAVELIFTDTHAELNGHSQPSVRAYFAEIEACARKFGFAHCWMSHLTQAAGPAATDTLDDPSPDDDTLERLATSAAKWYHGHESPERAALIYYKLNMVEKRAVEIAFPHAIFITFNGRHLRCLFPKRLPIFYMYSLRRGVSVKPWFFNAGSSH
jgi:L-tyrosine isonitrile synthase